MIDLQKHINLAKEKQQKKIPYIKKIIDIFEHQNIEYVVCFGTLLGCIRHKGFIPWDDDFDILVNNKDRNKTLSLLKEYKFLTGINSSGKFFDNYNIQIYNLFVFDIFFPQRIDLNEHKIYKNRIDNTYKYIFSNEKLSFEDFTIKVPSNYKQVLDEYYGNDWQTIAYVTNHDLINNEYKDIREKHGSNAFNLSFKENYFSFNIMTNDNK